MRIPNAVCLSDAHFYLDRGDSERQFLTSIKIDALYKAAGQRQDYVERVWYSWLKQKRVSK